jgi:DNA-binding transcriptional regulator YhcF (GntR family)
MRKAGLLTDFILFSNIKFKNIEDGQDLNGGFLKKSQVKLTSSQLGINYNTFRKGISKLVSLNWLVPTQTGYRLIGHRLIFNKYAEDLEISKLCIFAKSKKELVKKLGINLIKNNLKTQLYREYNGKPKNWKKNCISNFLTENRFTMSVRKMGYYLGYKSPMSIVRLQKELESEGMLKIERRTKRLCHASEYAFLLKSDDTLQSKCFIKDEQVYQRLCNNLTALI